MLTFLFVLVLEHLNGQLEMVGGVLDLLELPGKILSHRGVVVCVLGVGSRQLEVDVRPGDGIPSESDDYLDLLPAGKDELIRAGVVSLLCVKVTYFDGELVCTFL